VYIPTDTLYAVVPGMAGGTREIFAWPSVFDNSKLQRDTDYAGQAISFREGVQRTLTWLEENGKLADSDADDYEDRLVAAWQSAAQQLPRQT